MTAAAPATAPAPAAPGATRRAKGVRREAAVVEAAAELIAEQGLADLRMSDVAERAGMSVGHLTYYFSSKSELLLRAIVLSERQFHAEVERQLRRETDPWQRLGTLVELSASNRPGDPSWLLWFEVWARAGADQSVAAVQREFADWWRQRLADVVAYGVERGAFRGDDPERAVRVLAALVDGLSLHLTLSSPGLTRAKLLETVMGVAVDLLRPLRKRR